MPTHFEGYHALAKTEGSEHLACWAHVRRRFVEAVRVQPKGKRGRADEAVALIGNGRFNLTTGKALGAPVCVNLKTYPVKVEGGKVFLDVA